MCKLSSAALVVCIGAWFVFGMTANDVQADSCLLGQSCFAGNVLADNAYLFLGGTNRDPSEFQAIVSEVGGNHVLAISLPYDNNDGVYQMCNRFTDSETKADECPGDLLENDECYIKANECYLALRFCRIFGNKLPGDNQEECSYWDPDWDSANNIVDNLERILTDLGVNQFLGCPQILDSPNICWEKFVVGGSSQGAGMALMLGKLFNVKRVNQYAGTGDNFQYKDGNWYAATWMGIRLPNTTLNEDIYGLAHIRDPSVEKIANVYTAIPLQGAEAIVENAGWVEQDGTFSPDGRIYTAESGCIPGLHCHGIVARKGERYSKFWKWASGYYNYSGEYISVY